MGILRWRSVTSLCYLLALRVLAARGWGTPLACTFIDWINGMPVTHCDTVMNIAQQSDDNGG